MKTLRESIISSTNTGRRSIMHKFGEENIRLCYPTTIKFAWEVFGNLFDIEKICADFPKEKSYYKDEQVNHVIEDVIRKIEVKINSTFASKMEVVINTLQKYVKEDCTLSYDKTSVPFFKNIQHIGHIYVKLKSPKKLEKNGGCHIKCEILEIDAYEKE